MSSVPIACFYFLSSFYSFSFLLSCRISPSFFLFAVHLLLFLISFPPLSFLFLLPVSIFALSYTYAFIPLSSDPPSLSLFVYFLSPFYLLFLSLNLSTHLLSISLNLFLFKSYCPSWLQNIVFFNLPFLLFPCCTFPLYRMRFADQ